MMVGGGWDPFHQFLTEKLDVKLDEKLDFSLTRQFRGVL